MEKHNDVIEHMYEQEYGKTEAVVSLEEFKADKAEEFEEMGAKKAKHAIAKEHNKMTKFKEKQAAAQAVEDEKQQAKDEAAKAKQEANRKKEKWKAAEKLPSKPGDLDALAAEMDDGKVSPELATQHALELVAHALKFKAEEHYNEDGELVGFDNYLANVKGDLEDALKEAKKHGADFDYIKSERERMGDDFGSPEHLKEQNEKFMKDADYADNYKEIISGKGNSAVKDREAAFLHGAHNKFTEFDETGNAKHDVNLGYGEKDFEDHDRKEVSSGKTKRHPRTGEAFGDHHILQSLNPEQKEAVGELKQAQSDVHEAQEKVDSLSKKVDSLSGQLGTNWKDASEELEAAQENLETGKQNLQKAQQNAEEVGVPKELLSESEDDKPKQGPPDPEVARRKMLEGYVWHEETRHWIKKENLMALQGGLGPNAGMLISGNHEDFAMDEQGNASKKNFLLHGSGKLFQVGDGKKASGGVANHSNVVGNHIRNKLVQGGQLAYHGRKQGLGAHDKGLTPVNDFNLPGTPRIHQPGVDQATGKEASFMDQFKGGFGLFKAEDLSDLEIFLIKYNSADHLKDTNHVDDLLEYLHDFEEQLEREKKENSDNKSIIR